MKRQRELVRRLATLDSLSATITAVKSLAAQHLRQARAALEPQRLYRSALHEALARSEVVLPSVDLERAPLLIGIGSDLGLCGAYNVQAAEEVIRARAELGPGPTLIVGRRVARILRRRGLTVDQEWSGPTQASAVAPLLIRLSDDLLATFADGPLGRVSVVGSRFAGVGRFDMRAWSLLPSSLEQAGEPCRDPGYVDADHLAGVAVRELLYVELYAQLLESLASEHGARLIATQAADAWLDEHREATQRQLASASREATTQETLEIVATRSRRDGGATMGVDGRLPRSNADERIDA